jgi:hypothetical protein
MMPVCAENFVRCIAASRRALFQPAGAIGDVPESARCRIRDEHRRCTTGMSEARAQMGKAPYYLPAAPFRPDGTLFDKAQPRNELSFASG